MTEHTVWLGRRPNSKPDQVSGATSREPPAHRARHGCGRADHVRSAGPVRDRDASTGQIRDLASRRTLPSVAPSAFANLHGASRSKPSCSSNPAAFHPPRWAHFGRTFPPTATREHASSPWLNAVAVSQARPPRHPTVECLMTLLYGRRGRGRVWARVPQARSESMSVVAYIHRARCARSRIHLGPPLVRPRPTSPFIHRTLSPRSSSRPTHPPRAPLAPFLHAL